MSIDMRLSRLMPALSAQERAILILESWKRGEDEDPKWRSSMPTDQAREFNRLIGLMNGTVLNMGSYITVVEQLLEKLELRQCWLVALVLWEEHLTEIERAMRVSLKEPITESEYAAKQRELDEAWVPVAELADLLAGLHEGWSEGDFEAEIDADEREVTDAAWERVCNEKERLVRDAVTAGTLVGRGRGARLCVQEGAFNQWSGLTATMPRPEDGLSYRVLPDSEREEVESEKRALARLRDSVSARQRLRLSDSDEQQRVLELLAGHLRRSLGEGYADLSQAIDAVAQVLAEAAREFEGADPIKPDKREVLDRMLARLPRLADELRFLKIEVERPEPDSEMLELLRHMVRLD